MHAWKRQIEGLASQGEKCVSQRGATAVLKQIAACTWVDSSGLLGGGAAPMGRTGNPAPEASRASGLPERLSSRSEQAP